MVVTRQRRRRKQCRPYKRHVKRRICFAASFHLATVKSSFLPESATLSAAFSISITGRIRGANARARSLWKSTHASLEGLFFADLFVQEVTVETLEDRALQWEVLVETALDQALPMEARLGPGRSSPVLVTLEKVAASPELGTHYIACVEPPAKNTNANPTHPANAFLEITERVGYFELDFLYNRFVFSRAWKNMLGYADAELADEHATLIKLVHPEDSEATPDQVEAGEPGEQRDFALEFRMRHKSGHYLWVQSVGYQDFGSDGRLEKVVGIHLNIQERKDLEEETLLNEDRLLALTDRGPLGLFDLDLRQRTIFFSANLRRVLQAEDPDNPPEPFAALLRDRNPEATFPELFIGAGARGVSTRELRLRRGDARYVNLLFHLVHITNRRGEIVRIMGLQVETGEPPVTWTCETPPPTLQAALETVNEALVITGADGRVTFANHKAEKLTHSPAASMVGKALDEAVPMLHARDRSLAPNLADEVLASGTAISFSRAFLLAVPESEPVSLLLSCHPLRDEADQTLGALLAFRDPDEMPLTPEELIKSSRMEALGLLAGGVAHDFNNLLTTIVGGISLARETHDWALLEPSEKAGLAARNLTRQLLSFARGREIGRKTIDLASFVRDCARLFAAGSSIHPQIDYPEGLYPVDVDPARMSQVFQNLIINAGQAMEGKAGTLAIQAENITIPASADQPLPPGEYLRVSIKDTGKGIPPENLRRIFEPFYTTKRTGTGLGLSTVNTIVREHDGHITVASQVGVGTTLSVYLPKSERAVLGEVRRKPTFKFGSGRILFMDDDEEIAALAGAMLKRLDYTFDIVKNGEEALALYRRSLQIQRPYDAVILDLTIIGGMGGEATLKKLLEIDPDVRAIVSSGYSTEEMSDYFLDAGFTAVLAKPYRAEEMGQVLRSTLGLDAKEEDTEMD
jgi:two-component system, cell cycle sensor histidine kinase and response regulator CckA